MSFSTELDGLLNDYLKACTSSTGDWVAEEEAIAEAKAAIIELVKKEVIGEDEVFIDIPILDHLGRQTSVIDGKSYTPYMVAKNQLRAEQRKKLEGEKE